MNTKHSQPFGYAEMFELADVNQYQFGRFVGFNYHNPEKIEWTSDYNNIIGVTSANFSYISNLYEYWPNKYKTNKYGNICFKEDTYAEGQLEYDDINEFAYLKTSKHYKLIPIINDEYNNNLDYITRNLRNEWIPVTLLGRCIVEDDGSCIPGKKCYLYDGKDVNKYGTVTLSKHIKNQQGWHVLKRISKNTIMILLK